MYSVFVLTVSDKGSVGQREDESGALLRELVRKIPAEVVASEIVPDDREAIRNRLLFFSDQRTVHLILTTGGTGLSPRDVTPEATMDVLDRTLPGFGEAMRLEGYRKHPRAILSRAVAGSRGKTLIVNLPGSPRAVSECFETILPILSHAIEILSGQGCNCAATVSESPP